MIVVLALGLPPQQADVPEWDPTFPAFACTPEMAFCNKAIDAGLHASKRYGRGAAFVDVDGDGWDDIFLADCDNRWDPEGYGVSTFFLNQQDGTFTARPATELGIADADLVATWNGSFADYDNDGDPDLLLANGGYSGNSNLALYENRVADGAGFVSATVSSGIGAANVSPSPWWGSSWADYDQDGWVDVVVTRVYGTPVIFHNQGDGTFSDVSVSLGAILSLEEAKNPVWLDYDNDGDPDLYVAGLDEHVFYRNDDGKRFVNVTAEVFSEPFPYPEGWEDRSQPRVFAAAADDFNQDGSEDLYLGRWSMQEVLLLNDGSGRFKQRTTDRGLVTGIAAVIDEDPASQENTMGLGVGDLHGDGYPDVWIGTGHPPGAAPDIVFCNSKDDIFYRCTDQVIAGGDKTWKTRSHGTAFSDFDHDGDTDVVVNLGGHPTFDAMKDFSSRSSTEWPALFVNQLGPSGNTASVTLAGTKSNRDALGARIRVDGSDTRYYVVRSMQGFQSQNSKTQVLSLGAAMSATVGIRWPSGKNQELTVKSGDRITITEP